MGIIGWEDGNKCCCMFLSTLMVIQRSRTLGEFCSLHLVLPPVLSAKDKRAFHFYAPPPPFKFCDDMKKLETVF